MRKQNEFVPVTVPSIEILDGVNLVPLSEIHLPLYIELFNSNKVRKYVGDFRTTEEVVSDFHKMIKCYQEKHFCIFSDSSFLGIVGVTLLKQNKAELGIVLSSSSTKAGFAVVLLEKFISFIYLTFKVSEFLISIRRQNKAAIRAAKKLSFTLDSKTTDLLKGHLKVPQ